VHVLPKYACPRCKEGVTAPPAPPRPITRGLAGAGLLGELVVAKFARHQTLYRFEDFSARFGVHLSRSTLCDWVRQVAELMRPLYELQRGLVIQSGVIWTDDTPVTVLINEPPGSRKGRYWVYIGDEEHPYDVYDFTENRQRDGAERFLASYRGYLQAAAFSGYDGVYIRSKGGILEVACWAHARRKFFESLSTAAGESSLILEMIRRLYDIEARGRALGCEARTELRLQEAVPVLERIKAELDRLRLDVLPKSPLGKAVGYALNQWEALCRYTGDGRLTIDNNAAERRLRDQAIGRKNWLFLGNDKAGSQAAVINTILAGAKRHRLKPWAYLREVILALSVDARPEQVEALLPDRWAKAHPEHVLTHRLEESRQKARQRDRKRAERRTLRHQPVSKERA
jgi:transposase